MLTLLTGYWQHHKTPKAGFLDYIPRGFFGCIVISIDVVLCFTIGWIYNIFTFDAVFASMVTAYILLAICNFVYRLMAKELNEARSYITKVREIVLLRETEENSTSPDKKAQMELDGLRASHRRSSRSIEALMQENKNLKTHYRVIKEKYEKLKIDNFDEDSKNEKELNHIINKQKEKIIKMQVSAKTVEFPEWVSFLPYSEGDSLKDIKTAYRSLAKSLHPDSSKADGERMKRLNEAWAEAKKWFEEQERQL
ncbi:MAG: hypothetical protein KAJ75_04425 [Alphaproteobacteria bacterium]|nr:hypothetical protein [Alphaproteobacteria bacterium]